MSYCRFSDQDFQCDLYIYEDTAGGWTTHVAGRRRVFLEPLPQPIVFDADNFDAWFARYNQVMCMVESAPLEPIQLPYAGESFTDFSLDDLKDRLLLLRSIGYRFPDHVLETIDEEMKETHVAVNKLPGAEP